MRTSRIFAATAFAAITAGTFLNAPSAAADDNLVSQLPGANTAGVNVITDSDALSVTVTRDEDDDSKVNVSVSNNSETTFHCRAKNNAGDTIPHVVAPHDLVQKTVDYYRSGPFEASDSVDLPILGHVPTNTLLEFSSLPGGSSDAIGGDRAARAELFQEWDAAQLAGHTGEFGSFKIWKNGTGHEQSVTLNAPGHGERADFDAAALIYCVEDNSSAKPYVFYGSEKPVTNPTGSAGSSKEVTELLGSIG